MNLIIKSNITNKKNWLNSTININKINFISLNILHGKLMSDRFDESIQNLTINQYTLKLMKQIEKIM